jgi:hypothetical protein
LKIFCNYAIFHSIVSIKKGNRAKCYKDCFAAAFFPQKRPENSFHAPRNSGNDSKRSGQRSGASA